MPNVVDEIATRLEADGVSGGATGWFSGTHRMPKSPDKAVVVFPAGGLNPEPPGTVTRPAVQIRVRGEPDDPVPAFEKCVAAGQALDGLADLTLGTTAYAIIRQQSDVLPLGFDQNNRPEFSVTIATARGD